MKFNILKLKNFCYDQAYKLYYKLNEDPEDLAQDLIVHLLEKQSKYNSEKGSLTTWAGWEIRGYIANKTRLQKLETTPIEYDPLYQQTIEDNYYIRELIEIVKNKCSDKTLDIFIGLCLEFSPKELDIVPHVFYTNKKEILRRLRWT